MLRLYDGPCNVSTVGHATSLRVVAGMESVLFPKAWIVDNVVAYLLMALGIADDAVMESGLPCEIGMDGTRLFGYSRFVGTDDAGQRPRFRG